MKINSNTFENTKPEFVLKTVFGYDNFRAQQKEIIESVLSKKDTLVIMPTGGGKSLCYQIPALIMEGLTIVVSPLISLMQDQVASLQAAGIHAVFLNSSLSWEEYKTAVDDIKKQKVKIVYVSPEGLSTGRIRDLFTDESVTVSCITIDESHCISAWGHDFRPDYLEISSVRSLMPDAVMIALTATATEQVRSDIIKNLKLKNPRVFISSFNRENIFLEVQPKKNALEQVIKCIRKHNGESGIIYCNSRKTVDELTKTLDEAGYSVLNYHAGLPDEIRGKNQAKFVKDEVQIMVATIAFGMGIDKPNVRYVINYDLPKSVEEYYQEIGRAGRDGLPSSALLLYSAGDIHKIRFFFQDSANPEQSEALLQGMIKYSTARTCRRKNLLGYFGERFQPEISKSSEDSDEVSQKCCDICAAGEIPLQEMTIPVQKLMSCILRTQERFGTAYVVDVLLGSRQKRILDNGHNKISTWGIGTELSKDDWFELVEVLIQENYLRKEGDYNILKLTYAGKSALQNRDDFNIPFLATMPVKKTGFTKLRSERIVAEKPDATDEEAEIIVTNLRNWRKRKADDINVPPYVIFGDKTLYDLAAKKPKNKSELLNCYGIGSAKAEQFGSSILRIIAES